MIEPVQVDLSFGKCLIVSLKTVKIWEANGSEILFAKPGVTSDSWTTTGILANFAAITTGTETKPPLEKMTVGLIFLIIEKACVIPAITLNGSVKFCTEKYRRSFPLDIL